MFAGYGVGYGKNEDKKLKMEGTRNRGMEENCGRSQGSQRLQSQQIRKRRRRKRKRQLLFL